MNKGKYVFSQLLSFLDPFVFLRISKKYGGDKYVKTFSCWNQLAVMMFGQLSNRESLRDLVLATHAHANKAFHLGFGKHASKSTLADANANANRDYRIFEEFAYRVMVEARQCRATEIFKLGGKVYAFDSSTIDLCLSVFSWALFRKKKGGIKLHTLYDIETQIPTFFHITPARNHDTRAMDAIPYEENSFYIFDRAYNDFGRLFTIDGVGAYFVVRGKKNNDFKPMRWKRRLPAGVMSDAVGYMDGQLTMSKYPEKIRRILYLDPESGRNFIFFTNALNINPLKVAELYHSRWQIELFFKWLKQHLKVKKFWGQTENAVRIQIYTAVTAYCMMAIVQKKMDVQRSIYEMLQLVSVSLTDTVELKTLFCKPNCNIVNEPDGSTEPTLF